jgi:hypothetical protein
MKAQIAQFLSYLFHPVNIPLIGIALLCSIECIPKSFLIADSFYHISAQLKIMLLLLFAIFTWVAPLIAVFYLKYSGEIKSLEMDEREERDLPLGFMIFFFLVFFGLMYFYLPQQYIPQSVNSIILGGFFGMIALKLLNSKLKVSLHASGMGMLCGAVYTYLWSQQVFPFWLMPAVFLLSGLIVWARVFLGKHDLKESLYGFAVGFLAQLLGTVIFLF